MQRAATRILILAAMLATMAALPTAAATNPAGGNCGRCGGGLTELTLRYVGDLANARIQVVQKERSTNHVLFDGVVAPGGTFTVTGANRKGTLEPVLHIQINGRQNTSWPTSCEDFGTAGRIRGDFEVVSATSADGTKVCPAGGGDDDDGEGEGGGDDEGEEEEDPCCDGQVTELTLRYTGDLQDAEVRVTQRHGNRHITVFDGTVDPGGTFTVEGANRQGTLGPVIQVFVEGQLETRIHTSCSQPIGAGLVRGDFTVVEGTSRNGGALCPVQ
jgi:hypothetical protein